nr:DUF29 domain-containing protein [Thiocystis violacea]
MYERDFYAWTREQVRLLRAGHFDELSTEHLLKWQRQPEYPHRKGWRATIHAQRRRIDRLLADSLSLRPFLASLSAEADPGALDLLVRETPLDDSDLPERCPFSIGQILDNDVWPA